MIARSAIAIAALWLLASCGGDGGPSWYDAAEAAALPVISPTTVAEGDGWQMDVGSQPYETGEPPGLCLQLVVVDQPLGCITLAAAPGEEYGFGAVARVGGERVIWSASTMTDAEPAVSHFVVWSSASPNGHRIEPIRYGDVESLLWVMGPGEAPWGYQTIGLDGSLVASWSYVGLPAD